MNQPTSAKPTPSAPTPADAPVMVPSFEDNLQKFWDKNRGAILLVCVVALLAITGREVWLMYAAHQEKGVKEEFAVIGGQTDKLAAFADAHPDHPLAGVAYLQLADDNFEKADYKSAAANYLKAVGKLKNDAVSGRARLGAAMSQLLGGDAATGESALKSISGDPALTKNVRAEATYHLASLASQAGKSDELKKLVDEIGKIDASGMWSQRATLLLASAPAAPAAAPMIKFEPKG